MHCQVVTASRVACSFRASHGEEKKKKTEADKENPPTRKRTRKTKHDLGKPNRDPRKPRQQTPEQARQTQNHPLETKTRRERSSFAWLLGEDVGRGPKRRGTPITTPPFQGKKEDKNKDSTSPFEKDEKKNWLLPNYKKQRPFRDPRQRRKTKTKKGRHFVLFSTQSSQNKTQK